MDSWSYLYFQLRWLKTVFCFFEPLRTKCDFSAMALYCLKWLCYFFKVTLQCTFHCVQVINEGCTVLLHSNKHLDLTIAMLYYSVFLRICYRNFNVYRTVPHAWLWALINVTIFVQYWRNFIGCQSITELCLRFCSWPLKLEQNWPLNIYKTL